MVEYRHRLREARLERALQIEARFDTDPLLRFAMLCLDWGYGRLPIPPDYQSFVGRSYLVHAPPDVFDALRPKLSEKTAQDAGLILYRQAFVALFNQLDQIMTLRDRKLLDHHDLPQTRWAARQLFVWLHHDPSVATADQWFRPAIQDWYKEDGRSRSLDDRLVAFLVAGGFAVGQRRADPSLLADGPRTSGTPSAAPAQVT